MASNVKYNCIEKFAKNNSWKFKEYTNECVIWRGTDITNYFSMNQEGNFKQFSNNVVSSSGTWACDGLLTVPRNRYSNFILTTSDGVYYSSDGFKKRDNTSQTTPTTEPEKDDSFPLKMGKEGPNVVKLQKFLNDKVPSNPLTVNGTFDQKTNDKLIEYQKREGIIQ